MEGSLIEEQRELGTSAAGNGSMLPPSPTITPAIPPYVKLGLTVAYTIFYSLLFAFIYAQLWLVLRYRHKRFSYQTAFLFLCLLWAALRAVLFSFYFRDCVTANALGPFAFWLLYCFPVCLQFFTLSLMNLYCAQVRGCGIGVCMRQREREWVLCVKRGRDNMLSGHIKVYIWEKRMSLRRASKDQIGIDVVLLGQLGSKLSYGAFNYSKIDVLQPACECGRIV